MSILKSILHHYNKTSASYDTLHPETEVAQITDWSQGIVNTLASTALGSLISTLSSDSLMSKLMKLVLDVSGVKYLIDTNGYICFGEFFGGLIIQWGTFGFVDSGTFVNMPLSANPLQVIVVDLNSDGNALCMSTLDYTNGKFKVTGRRNDLSTTQLWGHWIAVCK